MKKEIQVIVTKDGKYNLYEYQNEIELEKMIVEHSSEIFGKNTRHFDIKKKIKSKAGFGTIPDGYVIDFEERKLYVVEFTPTEKGEFAFYCNNYCGEGHQGMSGKIIVS